LAKKVRIANTGNDSASCFQVSSASHQRTTRGGGLGAFILLCAFFLVGTASCDPLTGTGPGSPPDPKSYIHVDAPSRTVVVTLIAGHPATDIQFNYDGYGNGALVLEVPVGWQVTIQCENHGTVPNSCAVVTSGEATQPIQPDWSTSDPQRGLDPGQSASFVFTPMTKGSYRIASLVDGNEASGTWADLEVGAGGVPTLSAH
jgi:hypothetical protein